MEALAALALGALQTLAFVHTELWWLTWLCIAALAWRVAHVSPRRAALLGWAFGCAWIGSGTWWLFISLHRYGALAAPLAVLAVALLAMALSLYLAAAMWAHARWRSGHRGADAAGFAAWWLLAELARGVIFTGFPWVASGYAMVDSPLAALAPWVGVYGMGATLALLAALSTAGARGLAASCVLLIVMWWAPPGSFSQPTSTLRVALLQTGVAQDEKFALERMPQTLSWVAETLTRMQVDLVVAPETAVPLLPGQLEEFAPGYWAALQGHFAQPGRAALVGVPLGDFDRGYTNSVVGLSAGPDYRYDKQHLVPFGEFIPTGFRWFVDLMSIPLGDFSRGPRNPPSFPVLVEQVAPNICYEDLFGEELARRFAGATAPTIFANVSNIAWFGDTIAIAQHLNISRLRSLEFERPMLRATNTGATAVIDYRGRVTAQLPTQHRGVLEAEVQGRSGLTPFARWSARAGLWPLIGAALGVLLVAGLALRSQRAKRATS